MKKLNILIYFLVAITFITWLSCDILRTIQVPFLTYFGVTHWIPELLFMFCVAYDLSDKLPKQTINKIVIAIFFFPFLYYSLTGQTFVYIIFGFGAGALFSSIFFYGIYIGIKLKPTDKTCKIIDKKGYDV